MNAGFRTQIAERSAICTLGMGKEILLIVSEEEARFSWDNGWFCGLVRVHAQRTCEVSLLWGSDPSLRWQKTTVC